MFTIEDIMQVLPHRYPFLLVDRILEIEERKRIVGIKNVTINEPFFQGHFPGHPIMPGVLIIEAMAQVGGMLLMGSVPDPANKVVYFMSLDNVKFRRPVKPGDQLRWSWTCCSFAARRVACTAWHEWMAKWWPRPTWPRSRATDDVAHSSAAPSSIRRRKLAMTWTSDRG